MYAFQFEPPQSQIARIVLIISNKPCPKKIKQRAQHQVVFKLLCCAFAAVHSCSCCTCPMALHQVKYSMNNIRDHDHWARSAIVWLWTLHSNRASDDDGIAHIHTHSNPTRSIVHMKMWSVSYIITTDFKTKSVCLIGQSHTTSCACDENVRRLYKPRNTGFNQYFVVLFKINQNFFPYVWQLTQEAGCAPCPSNRTRDSVDSLKPHIAASYK